MKNKFMKKIAIVTLMSTMITTTGCSYTFIGEKVENYPLTKELTEQEVIDYYAKALEYDSIITRAADDMQAVITYQVQPVSGAKEETLQKLTKKVENLLSATEYEYTDENIELLPWDVWVYMKSTLDNVVLSNRTVTNIGGALGSYFVDVEYDLSSKSPGTFTKHVELLGLNGAWLGYGGVYKVNTGYMQTTMNMLNQYFFGKNIKRCAYFDQQAGTLEILENTDPTTYGLHIGETKESVQVIAPTESPVTPEDTEIGVDNETGVNIENNTGTEVEGIGGTEEITGENTGEQTGEQTGGEETKPTPTQEPESDNSGSDEDIQQDRVTYKSLTDTNRKSNLDFTLIRQVVGSISTQKAYLPSLDLVYNKPEDGLLSGFGIYPEATSGLKVFNYDRSKLNGKITIRYVFRDDMLATGKILGFNAYVLSEEIETGPAVTNNKVSIPEFLYNEIEWLIERMDRVEANIDLASMMSGNIYEDMGKAVLAGFKDSGSRTLKHMSTIRQVLDRNIDNNAYLIEIETTVMEGPRYTDVYGTYKDKYYVVIQQQGNKYVISDIARSSRTMMTEPFIAVDKAINKRIVALNLSNKVVDEDTRKAAQKLMSELYTAGTNRVLTETTLETGEVIRGFRDCFNSNKEMLSTSKYDYMTLWLQNKISKYRGTDAIYAGNITEYLGGYDNQVELVTEELIAYEGRDDGYYMQVYYLISNMEDKWVIDERKILDEYDVTGAELANMKERMRITQ